jgi:hypothetical protein
LGERYDSHLSFRVCRHGKESTWELYRSGSDRCSCFLGYGADNGLDRTAKGKCLNAGEPRTMTGVQ